MTPVRSSTLQAVAYDEASRTLFVQFRSSATYEYRDVPPETYGAMLAAHSIGRYGCRNLRGSGPGSRSGTHKRRRGNAPSSGVSGR